MLELMKRYEEEKFYRIVYELSYIMPNVSIHQLIEKNYTDISFLPLQNVRGIKSILGYNMVGVTIENGILLIDNDSIIEYTEYLKECKKIRDEKNYYKCHDISYNTIESLDSMDITLGIDNRGLYIKSKEKTCRSQNRKNKEYITTNELLSIIEKE